MANVKTNPMRILDKEKIDYEAISYDKSKGIDGISVANSIKKPVEEVYKTLVTVGHSKENYVFVVPVNKELDLKKAAKSVSEKSIEMINQKDLTKITGYMKGGCSPIGMKKQFRTVVDISAKTRDTIIVSAGKIGYQIELKAEDLARVIDIDMANVVVE